MTFSVNTNRGALIALQNFANTNRTLDTVQNRINTGLKVASAKDNGAVYAIAGRMRSDVLGLNVVKESLDRGISTVDVALAAGHAISALLREMQEKVVAARAEDLNTVSRNALNEDFKALRDQITVQIENAQFNGFNLIDSSGTSALSLLASADGTKSVSVGREDLSLGGSILTFAATATISTQGAASGLTSSVVQSIENLSLALARLGTGSKRLELHNVFVGKLSDGLQVGVGNLVDANLARESARLQAFQVKQQLGVQAVGLANQRPQLIPSLFSGS